MHWVCCNQCAQLQYLNAIEKRDTPFVEFLKEADPEMIYVTQTMFKNPNYLSDDSWREFINSQEQDSEDWVRMEVQGGEMEFMLLRPTLFNKIKDQDPQ